MYTSEAAHQRAEEGKCGGEGGSHGGGAEWLGGERRRRIESQRLRATQLVMEVNCVAGLLQCDAGCCGVLQCAAMCC